MEIIFAGYFPKLVARDTNWLKAPAVAEICSVSECLSPGPKGWIDHWLHNELGWYPNTDLARKVIPKEADAFEIFGYGLANRFYEAGQQLPLNVNMIASRPDESEWTSIGFDVVSRSQSSFFECSPLSCNGMATEISVNRHCLLEDADFAIALAERFSLEEPEPGPYYLVEVWRECCHHRFA